jgi:hypothetical protein
MTTQLQDGFSCFLGYNPQDPDDPDSCKDAFPLLMVYIVVNFVYNILLLYITKKGTEHTHVTRIDACVTLPCHAFLLLMVYIVVNFVYNILLLYITKKGIV